LRVCWFGAPSLTRGRVCRLQLLLALASAIIFGSESRRTRGHILLSQIRDFLFRRLLRLAGSRWRYSTPPPHGRATSIFFEITPQHGPHGKHFSSVFKNACLLAGYLATDILLLLRALTPGLCLQSRCLAMIICVTIYIYIRSDQTVARESQVASLNSRTSENDSDIPRVWPPLSYV
jgi:hypothetical protein